MIAVRYPHALDHRGPVGVIKTSAVDRGKVYSLHIHDPEGIDYNPSQAAIEPYLPPEAPPSFGPIGSRSFQLPDLV
ncbi:unnamed protein product, partial [marine sediment metagenome]